MVVQSHNIASWTGT